MGDHRWLVSQIGARQHYAVPLGFHFKGALRHFYTDAWCSFGRSLMLRGPGQLRSFAGRYHPHLPSSKVTSYNLKNTADLLVNRAPKTVEQKHEQYLRIGEWFAKRVAKSIERLDVIPGVDCFFGFDTGCLETLQVAKSRGIKTIVDQIDPAKVEEDLVFEESQKWPGWTTLSGRIQPEYWNRLAAEWATADRVLVNSQWSKDALIKQGVPDSKLIVVPLAYEPDLRFTFPRPRHDRPLHVLWLGSVNLRKGIQYLVEAARLLIDSSIQFTIAGPLDISEDAVRTAPANMKFIGRVTRDRSRDVYRSADVFVLPTLSDGFAVTQVEAMGYGLPVITTPNCGEVVTHGVDGLIVPPFDSKSLATAIASLDADRSMLANMSVHATRKVLQYHLPRQAEQVDEAVKELFRESS